MGEEKEQEKSGRHRRPEAEELTPTGTPGFEPRHGRRRFRVGILAGIAAALVVGAAIVAITVVPALSIDDAPTLAAPSGATGTPQASPTPTTTAAPSVSRTITRTSTSGPPPLTPQQLDALCAGQVAVTGGSGSVDIVLVTSDARCSGRPATAVYARYDVNAEHTAFVNPSLQPYTVNVDNPSATISLSGVGSCGLEAVFRGGTTVPVEVLFTAVDSLTAPWRNAVTCPA